MSGANPASTADTGDSPAPDPAVETGVIDPNAVDVPYSNVYLVTVPFGSTVPARLAPVPVTALAAPDTAAGGTSALPGGDAESPSPASERTSPSVQTAREESR